ESHPAERLVARPGAGDGNTGCRQKGGWSLPNHGVSADPLDSELAGTEGLAPRKEGRVGVPAVLQIDVAVSGTEHRRRQPRPPVEGVAHPFGAELVVADLAKDIAVVDGNEMEKLISSAAGGKRQSALFGDETVQFEFADLQVEPGAVKQVVEA